jgi:phosphoribosyl 1,2-cyclic phosphate phosphodiesterase
MQITILGCGGSDGVPQIGCKCNVCISTNPKNNRTRASVLVKIDNFYILIDAGPDLRQQSLREGIDSIDAVLITHAHYDHIAGIGDLKLFMKHRCTTPIFSDQDTADILRYNFEYAFSNKSKLYPPMLNGHTFSGAFSIVGCSLPIIPFKQKHGKVYSYGFRIGDFAYSTDVSLLDDNAYDILAGVKLWIIDYVRYFKSPTHFAIDDTIAAILRVKPERAVLTHMCHDIDYELMSEILPNGLELAYDGMKLKLSLQ